MKPLSRYLAVSVAANVALLLVFATNRAGLFSSASIPSGEASSPAKHAEPVQPSLPFWQRFDSSNLDELSRHLKEAGFSRQEIRAIIEERISEKYDHGYMGDPATPYWRNSTSDYTDPKARQESMARAVEREELTRKYINGPEFFDDDPGAVDNARNRYGNLAVEKLRALSAIEADYQLLALKREAARVNSPEGRPGDSEREAFDLLEKEKKADIEKLLTPAEYTAYELRNGRTAQALRLQLESFKPTEEEYKALFAIKKTFDEPLMDKTLSPEARSALMEQMNAQTVAAIGPDRAADYQESQRGMDKTARLISRLDLPARTNAVVRNIQQDVTQRAAAVRADPQLSAADRAAQLSTLAETTRAQLTTALGDRGFEAYNDMKGDWIRALEPKPAKIP